MNCRLKNRKGGLSLIILITLTICQFVHAQQVKLQVTNSDGKNITGVTITTTSKNLGITNTEGFIYTNKEEVTNTPLTLHTIGYKKLQTSISSNSNQEVFYFILQEEQSELDEVIVTAGRKPQHISTIPSSVTILNTKDIENQSRINPNISSILGNAIPGLGVSTNKASNSGQTLRGRQVLILIDGIPQSTPLMNGARDIRTIDPSVIERIEVIKGATSIYGNGSGGGIINYITKQNAENKKFGGSTNLASSINPAHSKETAGYRFSQNLYGKSDKWKYMIAGTIDYLGLQRDSDGQPLGQIDGLSNTRSYNTFAKLSYELNQESSLTLLYNFYGSRQHSKYISKSGKYQSTPTIGILGEEPGEPAGTRYNHNAMLTYSNSDLFLNTHLDAILYSNFFSSMNRYVSSGSAWYGPGQTMINSDKSGFRLNLNTPFSLSKTKAEITYGIDILKDVTYQDLVDGRVYIPKLNMINIAPYAQLRMDFFENLIVKAGVRHENANVKVKDFNTIATGPNNQGSVAVTGGTIPYKATTWNAGIRYNKLDYFNPFVSFSQGFAISELGRILRRAKQNTLQAIETDPILTDNYEVGFTSKLSIFNFSTSYYLSTSKLGVNMIDVGGFLMPQREPEKVRGFEIATDIQILQQIKVGATYAYVEGKATLDNGEKIFLNGARISPPKATAYINFQPKSNIDVQLNWIHTGTRDRFNKTDGLYKNSEGPVRPVNLLHLSSGYNINQRWKISVGIENILNTDYYPVVSQYRAFNDDYVKGNGINATLNLNYTF